MVFVDRADPSVHVRVGVLTHHEGITLLCKAIIELGRKVHRCIPDITPLEAISNQNGSDLKKILET